MSAFRTLDSADLKGKRVLVRVDLNLPMENGKVTDATRIERILPTLNEISQKGGKVILLAHFGRPKNGPDEANSLKHVVGALEQHLGKPVAFASDCIGPVAAEAVAKLKDGDFLLLENTRFHKGEEKNDPALVDALALLGDIYVNDAFSAAHRAHASTEGVAHKLPAYAGRTMQAEVEALSKALDHPQRPVAAVVGGAKVSTKLELLGNLTKKVDFLIIGGGMANTFLAAQGKKVGKSLCEHDLLDTAREILKTATENKCRIVLPVDVVVAQEFKAHAPSRVVAVEAVGDADMILDAGPKSVAEVEKVLGEAKTLVWNGPFGAFELEPFDAATNAVAKFAARLTGEGKLLTVAGGGDTVAALNHAGVAEQFTYVSTAGGAFLEWLEGKVLPGVEAIRA
ncbi:phosphoglycerate kinase [Rhodoblastus sphagnicola]|uniref:Phosphoglycerate kinase n=1 Tax=Rhodoblastus sphagnicola TaxID=333368 RepID=A0A2S6N757_9HYPH|nr:phosphoglycerate kinase [Rhodoblastus sphagnicola]MBB4197416.1 phosphoglycerate kinase [Rhodoblastus sphagnicola]PPQ30446.1 phosphoglycerate kinase [Rhodoblastus sphagnicola]